MLPTNPFTSSLIKLPKLPDFFFVNFGPPFNWSEVTSKFCMMRGFCVLLTKIRQWYETSKTWNSIYIATYFPSFKFHICFIWQLINLLHFTRISSKLEHPLINMKTILIKDQGWHDQKNKNFYSQFPLKQFYGSLLMLQNRAVMSFIVQKQYTLECCRNWVWYINSFPSLLVHNCARKSNRVAFTTKLMSATMLP